MTDSDLNDTAEAGSPQATPTPDAPKASSASDADVTPAPVVAEVLAPKERRRRSRSAKSAKTPTRAPRTAVERHEERVAERIAKAGARRVGRERSRAKERATEHSREATPPREHVPGKPKSRQGLVVSDKADKTITVRIDMARRHRRYSKVVRTSTTLHVHDERNDAHAGDTVLVLECRPLSRTKRWRLIEVLERAK